MPRYDEVNPTRPTPQATTPAAVGSDALSDQLDEMRRDLRLVRMLSLALLGLVILLTGVIYHLSGRLETTERSVNTLPRVLSQAADQKLAQLSPQLQDRLDRFEAMSRHLEQRLNAAESGVLDKIRTETPKILDSYAQTKIDLIRQEAERIQRNLRNNK